MKGESEPVQQRIMCSINSLIVYFNITMANNIVTIVTQLHIVVVDIYSKCL